MQIFKEILFVLNESAVYLLLGFGVAGILHVVLARYRGITALLSSGRPRSVFLAALFGLPMPLCSCSVLPAALALRREGASKGATVSFLVSVPETDIVSIMLTYALLGPVMAIYRPLAALVTAIIAGLGVSGVAARTSAATADEPVVGECCHKSEGEPVDVAVTKPPGWRAALRYGYVDMFDDIVPQLLLGIVLAGALVAWLPNIETLGLSGGSVWVYAIMLAVGVPLYVCATASTPVAAALIAGGVSPGAGLVFLLAGPATNVASLLVLKKQFSVRELAVYWAAIGTMSVLAGVLFDRFFSSMFTLRIDAVAHEHGAVSPLHMAGTVVFLALVLVTFVRRISRWKRRKPVTAEDASREPARGAT